jgi:hypothetical protein
MYLPLESAIDRTFLRAGMRWPLPFIIFHGCVYWNPECCRSTSDADPHHFGNLDPHPDPDPHPHQIKIRIRICINFPMTSQNVLSTFSRVSAFIWKIESGSGLKVESGSASGSASNKNRNPYSHPDPHQGCKSNPDPHQCDADPQHCVTHGRATNLAIHSAEPPNSLLSHSSLCSATHPYT